MISPRSSLHLADLCCSVYLGASAIVLVVFGGAAYSPRAAFYLLALFAVVAFAHLPASFRRSRAWSVVGALYPVVVVAVTWGELRLLIPLVWGDDFWATGWAVGVDAALFGGPPTAMIQTLYRPWLDEAMAVIYLSYYVFLAVPLVLLSRGRLVAARAAAAAIALTYTVNFAIFVLLPIKSPPQILAEYPELLPGTFTGWLAADALRALQGSESVTGAAFPSSHVAGSVVCALAAHRWLPRLGRILLPTAAGVSVATVYLGYHHAIDPLAGIVWGVAAWFLASAWMSRRGELPPKEGS